MHMVHNDESLSVAPWPFWGMLLAVSNLSHSAVIVFFVLSGYLVGGKVFSAVARDQFALAPYAINRISRLYVVLIVALPVGFALDMLGLHLFDINHLYRGQSPFPILSFSVEQRLNCTVALSNFCQLQTIYTPTLGSNSPLWSLANEWWYYVLCPPLAWLITRRRIGILRRCMALTAVLLISWLINGWMLIYATIWLLGAGAAVWRLPRLPAPRYWLIGIAFIMASIGTGAVYGVIEHLPGRLRSFSLDATVALLIAGLLIAQAQRPEQEVGRVFSRLNHILANYSYSLYLSHFPLCLLLSSIAQQTFGVGLQSDRSGASLAVVICLFISAQVLALGMAWISEFRTEAVRRALYGWLLRPSSGNSATRPGTHANPSSDAPTRAET
jgi:peptidoglycan/LPS O-acetylase OafA/YrhL